MNRRVATLRGLFEYAVITGARESNPVTRRPRSMGLRAHTRGLLGHLGLPPPARQRKLVRHDRRLPESVDMADLAAFVADLATHGDRAMALAMVLAGLRSAEVRGLLLAKWTWA